MARPKKDKMDYFPHDTDAVNDEKIEALRSIYGNDGYAFYFILLERIYRTEKAELDVSKPILVSSLSSKVGVSKERFDKMLKDACDLQLFDFNELENNQVITSIGVKKRFSEVNKIRQRWRKSKENSEEKEVFRAENSKENESKTDIFHEENTLETGESKVKESKVKESKEKKLINGESDDSFEKLKTTIKDMFNDFEEADEYAIKMYLNQGMEPDVILLAFQRTLMFAASPTLRYAKQTLNKWFYKHLLTVAQVEEKDPPRVPGLSPPKKENVPKDNPDEYLEPPDFFAEGWK